MNANNSEYHRNFAPPKQKGQRYSPTLPSIDMPRHKRCMHDACRIPLPIKRDMAQLIQSRFAKAWNKTYYESLFLYEKRTLTAILRMYPQQEEMYRSKTHTCADRILSIGCRSILSSSPWGY